MNKRKELKRVAAELQKSPCPLRKHATRPVPGEGNPNADILFIGEAPGKTEDETGRPFVGSAGRLLTQWLKEVGLARDDVFITNIEKFRPANNRDPNAKEIHACFPYLKRQIEIIDPTYIVTLGRHALQRMLEWEKGTSLKPISMGEYHGKPIKSKKTGRSYFPLYHPAAILYNRSLEPRMQEAFNKLARLSKPD